jgi:hypothetical protein
MQEIRRLIVAGFPINTFEPNLESQRNHSIVILTQSLSTREICIYVCGCRHYTPLLNKKGARFFDAVSALL